MGIGISRRIMSWKCGNRKIVIPSKARNLLFLSSRHSLTLSMVEGPLATFEMETRPTSSDVKQSNSEDSVPRELQRLAQALFQLGAIGSADSKPRSVLQHHLELAVRNWFKVQNALDIDDCRSVNPHESHGIQFFDKLIQRGAIEQLFSASVQVHVHAGRFDPVNVHDS